MKLFMLVFGSALLNPETPGNVKLSDTDIPHSVEAHVESAYDYFVDYEVPAYQLPLKDGTRVSEFCPIEKLDMKRLREDNAIGLFISSSGTCVFQEDFPEVSEVELNAFYDFIEWQKLSGWYKYAAVYKVHI